MGNVVVVSAKRTPIGKFGGSLSSIAAPQLGAYAIEGALDAIGLDKEAVELVIMGNVIQAGLGQNPARQAAMAANILQHVPAFTVNEVCGSGLKAIHLGMQAIRLKEQSIVVVGGFENMSQAPYLLKNSRFGAKYNNLESVDALYHDGLMDAYNHQAMGVTAENVAEKYNISREEQDIFATLSQNKAQTALTTHRFETEIVGIETRNGSISLDEGVRFDTTQEGLARLKPAFKEQGTVTAGNASTINDGAVALVLMSEEEAKKRNLNILATLHDYVEIGNDPNYMGFAPYYAIDKLMVRNGLKVNEIDRYEINEAFASQSVAVVRNLGLDERNVNVNGGAIALGHPIGASGARIVVSLIHELMRSDLHSGVTSLCIGGGMGSALYLTRGEK